MNQTDAIAACGENTTQAEERVNAEIVEKREPCPQFVETTPGDERRAAAIDGQDRDGAQARGNGDDARTEDANEGEDGDITIDNDAGAAAEVAADEIDRHGADAPLYERDGWQEMTAQFMTENPIAVRFGKELAQVLLDDKTLAAQSDCLPRALNRVLAKAYRSPQEMLADENARKTFAADRSLRDQIIAEYLYELQTNKPPKSMTSGGEFALTPPTKINSIEAAGRVMKQMLENRRNQW